MAQSSPKRYKTLWEKEKLLVTSNFFFFHSVFKRLVQQTRKNQGLFGKGLKCLHRFSWNNYRPGKCMQTSFTIMRRKLIIVMFVFRCRVHYVCVYRSSGNRPSSSLNVHSFDNLVFNQSDLQYRPNPLHRPSLVG